MGCLLKELIEIFNFRFGETGLLIKQIDTLTETLIKTSPEAENENFWISADLLNRD